MYLHRLLTTPSETIFSLSTNPRTTHAELWIIIGSEDLQKPPRWRHLIR